MNYVKSKQRVADHGEVFTPAWMVEAAERRTTLKELVFQGLAQVIEQPVEDAEVRRRATIQKLLDRMEATNTKPMVPLRRDEIYDR